MKFSTVLLSAFLLLLCCCGGVEGGSRSDALLTLADSVADFGTIADNGAKVSRTFTFTNTGSDPLVIQKAETSCHCAQPAFSQAPVVPGKQGSIKVTLNPKEMFTGVFQRTITVYSNASNGVVRLHVSGVVK